MNLLGKVTKTQGILILLTLSFLVSLTLLYHRADDIAAGTHYTITTTRRAPGRITPQPDALVDINTATADELQTLTGIGAAMAQRIIDYRAEHGPFTCADDLLAVKGIGEATLDKFRDRITFSAVDPSEHDHIPSQADETAEESPPNQDQETPQPDEPQQNALIDINTATADELQTLTGIGPVLAQRIIDYRAEHGPFTCAEDLLAVKGIGEATLNKFRHAITVGSPGKNDTTTAEEPAS